VAHSVNQAAIRLRPVSPNRTTNEPGCD
jgi:hypothetical protein